MLMAALCEAEGEHWVITNNLQSLSTGNEQDSLRQPIITSSAYTHYSAEPQPQRRAAGKHNILNFAAFDSSWCQMT